MGETMSNEKDIRRVGWIMSIASAFFYGFISTFITLSNKILLGSLKANNRTFTNDLLTISYFPIMLAQIQCTFAVFILFSTSCLGLIVIEQPKNNTKRLLVFGLSLVFVSNLTTGLASTKALSLPMFVVLRRMSIILTMVLQRMFLDIKSSFQVKMSVFFMLAGSVIAAYNDLSFNAFSYALVGFNDLLTAVNGIMIKHLCTKSDSSKVENSKDKFRLNAMNPQSLLFWNSLLSLPLLTLMVCLCRHSISKNRKVLPPLIISGNKAYLITSAVSGFLLNLAIIMCTKHNSPLTTTIVGVMKNTLVTYVGMVLGDDYEFSPLNFIGINVSVLGAFTYVWANVKSIVR